MLIDIHAKTCTGNEPKRRAMLRPVIDIKRKCELYAGSTTSPGHIVQFATPISRAS
mgnify:CR=1 FL=1